MVIFFESKFMANSVIDYDNIVISRSGIQGL